MIGERIRCLRESLNLSRSAFGEKLSVSADVVNNWERNRATVSGSHVKLISFVYRVNEEWLLQGTGDMHSEPLLFESRSFGPAGTALMTAAARLYEMLGEDKTRDFLQSVSLTDPVASSDGE